MSAPFESWAHVVKIDPDKTLHGDDTFEDVCETGTDAIEIGGTTGMTESKMARVVDACAAYDIPIYIEPSNIDSVLHRTDIDGFLVPVVFNAGDVFWTTGAHKEWALVDGDIDWDRTFTEAYVVMNPDSDVARYTEADCELDADDVEAYARVAEQLFDQDIFYVEYSGTYGDPAVVRQANAVLEEATLFYGGGIGDYDRAYEMGQHADTIVVGDLVHDEGVEAVAETVDGVRDAHDL